ncbi:unnamed protein product [Oikopleura dioica]|uniref:Uncharacterized protein n=1 Tax=Oikopleura dioica TaxID=34765 RepID=E4WUS1_OIKDI|nr:unnamed protein product [Oikopleura dioica]
MDRGSINTNKHLFNSTYNIVDVVNDDIEYCTNEEVLGSESGRCETIPVKADSLFKVDGGTVKLISQVEMKTIGGPRHMIKLKTSGDCFVYYKVYIFPDTAIPITAEAELSDRNSILELISLPTQSLTNNGLNPLFELKIYDNVFCAIRDECRLFDGVCLGGNSMDAKPLDLWSVNATNSGDLVNPKIVDGEIIEVKANAVDEMGRFWYSKDESNAFQKFHPETPLCTVSVEFDWRTFDAKSLAGDVNLTETLSIDKISIHGAFQNVLLANADIGHRVRFNTESPKIQSAMFSQFATPPIIESVAIADVNDLPAIFVMDSNCTSYTACIATIGDQHSITVEYNDCKNSEVLLEIGTDIFIIDGDRNRTDSVSLDSSFPSTSFDLDGNKIKCKSALPPGEHSFTLKAKETNRDDRSSYLSVVVTVNDPVIDWNSIIDLTKNTGPYEYIDAPSYVRNIEDQTAFIIDVYPPPDQEVILILDTPGFTLTENNELLKTGASSASQDVTLIAKLFLLENDAIIAQEIPYILGTFNIAAPCPTLPPTTTELPVTSTCPEVICPTPEPCINTPPPTTEPCPICPEETTTACPACPVVTTTACPTVPPISTTACPVVSTTVCPEFPTVSTTVCPVVTTTECPVCPTVSTTACPTVSTTLVQLFRLQLVQLYQLQLAPLCQLRLVQLFHQVNSNNIFHYIPHPFPVK